MRRLSTEQKKENEEGEKENEKWGKRKGIERQRKRERKKELIRVGTSRPQTTSDGKNTFQPAATPTRQTDH